MFEILKILLSLDRRRGGRVKKLSARKIGEKYYIFARRQGKIFPVTIGRYSEKGRAERALKGICRQIK